MEVPLSSWISSIAIGDILSQITRKRMLFGPGVSAKLPEKPSILRAISAKFSGLELSFTNASICIPSFAFAFALVRDSEKLVALSSSLPDLR